MDIEQLNKQKEEIEKNTLDRYWSYIEHIIKSAYLRNEKSVPIQYTMLYAPIAVGINSNHFRNLKRSDLDIMLDRIHEETPFKCVIEEFLQISSNQYYPTDRLRVFLSNDAYHEYMVEKDKKDNKKKSFFDFLQFWKR